MSASLSLPTDVAQSAPRSTLDELLGVVTQSSHVLHTLLALTHYTAVNDGETDFDARSLKRAHTHFARLLSDTSLKRRTLSVNALVDRVIVALKRHRRKAYRDCVGSLETVRSYRPHNADASLPLSDGHTAPTTLKEACWSANALASALFALNARSLALAFYQVDVAGSSQLNSADVNSIIPSLQRVGECATSCEVYDVAIAAFHRALVAIETLPKSQQSVHAQRIHLSLGECYIDWAVKSPSLMDNADEKRRYILLAKQHHVQSVALAERTKSRNVVCDAKLDLAQIIVEIIQLDNQEVYARKRQRQSHQTLNANFDLFSRTGMQADNKVIDVDTEMTSVDEPFDCLKSDDLDLSALTDAALLARRRHRHIAATELLDGALQIVTSSSAASARKRQRLSDIYNAYGRLAQAVQDFDGALQYFDKSADEQIDIDSQLTARQDGASTLMMAGRYHEALARHRKILDAAIQQENALKNFSVKNIRENYAIVNEICELSKRIEALQRTAKVQLETFNADRPKGLEYAKTLMDLSRLYLERTEKIGSADSYMIAAQTARVAVEVSAGDSALLIASSSLLCFALNAQLTYVRQDRSRVFADEIEELLAAADKLCDVSESDDPRLYAYALHTMAAMECSYALLDESEEPIVSDVVQWEQNENTRVAAFHLLDDVPNSAPLSLLVARGLVSHWESRLKLSDEPEARNKCVMKMTEWSEQCRRYEPNDSAQRNTTEYYKSQWPIWMALQAVANDDESDEHDNPRQEEAADGDARVNNTDDADESENDNDEQENASVDDENDYAEYHPPSTSGRITRRQNRNIGRISAQQRALTEIAHKLHHDTTVTSSAPIPRTFNASVEDDDDYIVMSDTIDLTGDHDFCDKCRSLVRADQMIACLECRYFWHIQCLHKPPNSNDTSRWTCPPCHSRIKSRHRSPVEESIASDHALIEPNHYDMDDSEDDGALQRRITTALKPRTPHVPSRPLTQPVQTSAIPLSRRKPSPRQRRMRPARRERVESDDSLDDFIVHDEDGDETTRRRHSKADTHITRRAKPQSLLQQRIADLTKRKKRTKPRAPSAQQQVRRQRHVRHHNHRPRDESSLSLDLPTHSQEFVDNQIEWNTDTFDTNVVSQVVRHSETDILNAATAYYTLPLLVSSPAIIPAHRNAIRVEVETLVFDVSLRSSALAMSDTELKAILLSDIQQRIVEAIKLRTARTLHSIQSIKLGDRILTPTLTAFDIFLMHKSSGTSSQVPILTVAVTEWLRVPSSSVYEALSITNAQSYSLPLAIFYNETIASRLTDLSQTLTIPVDATTLHICTLISALLDNSLLTDISFADSAFNDDCAFQLTRVLLEHNALPNLTALSLAHTNMSAVGVAKVVVSIRRMHKLSSIDLSDSLFNYQNMTALSQSVSHMTAMRSLKLSGNKLMNMPIAQMQSRSTISLSIVSHR